MTISIININGVSYNLNHELLKKYIKDFIASKSELTGYIVATSSTGSTGGVAYENNETNESGQALIAIHNQKTKVLSIVIEPSQPFVIMSNIKIVI